MLNNNEKIIIYDEKNIVEFEGITEGKTITFNIYGVETRDSSRSVEYVSETVSETEPTTQLRATSDNFGSISKTQSSHKGVVAQLWKIVYNNGVEQSREVVNHSTYSMSPTVIRVGTANASPEALNELNAAIAANDEAAARAVIGKYAAAATTANEEAVSPDAAAEGVVTDPATAAEQTPAEGQQPAEQQQEQAQPEEQQPAEQQQGQPAQ